jgi:hypothetical protein
MISSRVSWRSNLKKVSGTLKLDDKLTLTDETGNVVFSVLPSEIKNISIQSNMFYIKLKDKKYSINITPEINDRHNRQETNKNFMSDTDNHSKQWKQALEASGVQKVKRVPWIFFFILMILLLIFNWLV